MDTSIKNILKMFAVFFVGITVFLLLIKAITAYEYIQTLLSISLVLITAMSFLTSTKMTEAANAQAEAARIQADASRESLNSNVVPKLIFSIRPANDYWKYPEHVTQSWAQGGVGIYIESLGLGPAIDIKFKCVILGEKKELSYDIEFSRMVVGQRYTIPSNQYPSILVDKSDSKILIKDLQFEDIRTPATKYTENGVKELELKPEHFEEPDKTRNISIG